MSELYIFTDTNLFMHYMRLDQVDWRALSGTKKVIIVLSPAVIVELDKHKNQHPVRRLKDRARDIVSWIKTLKHGAEVAPGVSVEFLVREPAPRFFADGLDPAVPDDRIIASVLERAASGQAVAVATDDTTLSLKVRARDIRWIEVPEDCRLKEEPDPLEAENARLRRENRELAHRLPKPVLLWTEDQENKELTITLGAPEGDPPPKPNQMRRLHRPLPLRKGPTSVDPWARFTLGMLTDDEINAHNKALVEFYTRYEQYYAAEMEWRDRSRRVLGLDFTVSNQGTSSANDVTVTVAFPERLTLIDPKKQPPRPDRPQPPRTPEPGTAGGLARLMAGISGATGYASPLGDIAALYRTSDFRRPILNHDRNSVRFDLPKLQHGWLYNLDPVYCLADPSLVGSAASLAVETSADELPSAVKAKLVLKVSDGAA